jgi:DNA-binding CsgD family transcriptional regulator
MTTSIPDDNNLPFIGRSIHIEQLRQVLQAAQDGRVQTVFVQGEAGIGKTRLVSVTASEAEQGGWLVLRGRAQTMGQGLAFAPLIEAFRTALLSLSPSQKSQVGEAFPYLNAFVPDLGGSLPVPLLDPGLERTRLFETLRRFTVHLAAEQPLLLWLDDLPEADPDTLEWLQYCMQHTAQGRLVILATCRTSYEPPAEAFRQLETYFIRHRLMQTIQLEPLPASDSIELMRTQLDGQVQDTTLQALRSRTMGVPLYILEVVHMLVHSGGLQIQNGSWALQDGAHDRVPLSITSLLEHRMENLKPTEQDVLTLIAVSDTALPWTLLQKASGSESAPLTEAILGLLQRGLLREEKNGHELEYEFRHPMIKAVAHARVPQTMLRQAHQKLAGAWFDHDVAHAAFHILASGSASDVETSARMLYEAGKRYLSLRSYPAATEYLEQAAQLVKQRAASATADLQWDIRLTLSEALTYVDRAQQALLLLDELFHEATERATKIRLKRFMAWVESTRSYEECVRHIVEGLEEWDGQTANADVLWMLNERVFNDLNSGQLAAAQTSLQALQAYAREFPSARASLLCLIRETHVALLSWNGPSTSRAQADGLLAEVRKLGEPELIYDAYCLIGYAALDQGDFKTALRYATECAALVRRNGMVIHEISVRMVGMCALFLRGDWEQSLREAEDVELLAREYEVHGAVVCTLDLRALILLLQGQRSEGAALLQESEKLTHDVFQAGGPHTDAQALHVFHAAEQLLQETSPKSREPKTVYWANAHGMQMFLKWIEGLWLLQAGLEEHVDALLHRLQIVVPEHHPNYVSGIVELLSGILAQRHGDVELARERLTRAMRTFEALRIPLELAVARIMWAQAVEPEQGNLALQQSLEELRRIGAHACAEWVARSLSSQTVVGSLSSREREIAEYVMQGLANKEIAEKLQLSPRTVSTHLEKIYRKLDVHSRIALARKLNQTL